MEDDEIGNSALIYYTFAISFALFKGNDVLNFAICVVDLDEIELANISYIWNSLVHFEKIPQPPVLV